MQTCNNKKVSKTLCKDRELLHNRLIEAGLSPNRFHKLRGTTKIAYYGFKESQKTALELDNYPSIGVNVGNGLVIVDFDEDGYTEAHSLFTDTFTVRSGGRGKPHYYLKVIGDFSSFDSTKKLVFGDLKLKNGYCVSPGSHIDYHDEIKDKRIVGNYTILKNAPIKEVAFNEFITNIIPYFKQDSETDKLRMEDIENGVTKGRRNTKGNKIANLFIGKHGPEKAKKLFEEWNQKNKPPLPQSELELLFNGALDYQSRPEVQEKNKKKTKGTETERKRSCHKRERRIL